MDIAVIGAYTTRFGELWGTSPRALAREAVGGALDDAKISKQSIDALYVGNMLSGILGGQEHLGAFFAEELNLSCPAYKVEGACASGGLAVHSAIAGVKSGQYRTVLVLGIEKMTDHTPEDVAIALMSAGSDEERVSGVTFPGLYAILARAHTEAYGTTEKQLASVSVKNHYHASLNPKAHFQKQINLNHVLESPRIADPLKLLDCSPISDGASAVIISQINMNKTKKIGNSENRLIQIIASAVATDTLGLAQRRSLTELSSTKKAGISALREAGISCREIDIAEVHDCFSIAEILAMEDLGFYEKGKAAKAIENGKTSLVSGGAIVVNPSGGLKACGHPAGATGVRQIAEIVEQLRGRCDKRQVKNARFGLAQNVGGSGATAVVHIFKSI